MSSWGGGSVSEGVRESERARGIEQERKGEV